MWRLVFDRPGQAQLYRILTAYGNLDRRIGYCQGMNFLGGLLLAVGLNEIEAFYTFVSLMLRYGWVWSRIVWVSRVAVAVPAQSTCVSCCPLLLSCQVRVCVAVCAGPANPAAVQPRVERACGEAGSVAVQAHAEHVADSVPVRDAVATVHVPQQVRK